ncbi:NAD(P)(+) transhydrogenase (Re/Si-specific) subunit beta [Desulfobulbus oligotrophicus]|uniref:NAD(P) transhydrogenase subunit beta n=1 Tax=Desulfobulbus oligotrophicus TaxID=1909699 RepID=A0A7T5VF95_9BACT|nr:NAD(P)(+) transhydrogenase (Re/Si-specific) subunit beta [Desulfobulbus oligotrophicus]MDY0389901.1 NAD(P)(+) transhydrogenase (Re/Si-specific) subunit beta [Desulfobulbus oligotrophicus]QQG66838.1 NAD(P)(+) transhydrogenase (Re/Si-specific) subunit beta [Desulfobulbus oligotrophicus]
MNLDQIEINFVYVVSAALFVFGLKMLSSPATARRGNLISALGMLIAIVATLLAQGLDFRWILIGMVIGSLLGMTGAYFVKMTAMPEMVALFNGFGGLASLLLAWSEYHQNPAMVPTIVIIAAISVFIGGVTFTGSMVAFGKLAGKLPQKAIVFKGQHLINAGILLMVFGTAALFYLTSTSLFGYFFFVLLVLIALGFGVTSTIPIGGADMPVVISLLNSYSGLAACAAGFVVSNNILIVAGALVGASGIILTQIMCKAMNRSLANVLFSGFGSGTVKQSGDKELQGEVKPASAEDVYYILEAADSVAFVPGYGLAVAQAQHVVKELGDLLEANGSEVVYAIHPVAGRMPGHMNVLLAEANVSYDQLVEMDDINPRMDAVDVCVVIGANDVVNPAAVFEENSPIYGMPIIETYRAKTVIVLKRSMSPGFAGIENALFFRENTRMYFGDAKASIQALVAEFKSGG